MNTLWERGKEEKEMEEITFTKKKKNFRFSQITNILKITEQ